MCGIAGILRVHRGPPPPVAASIPEGWLDILDEGIRHRGPDGHGRFRDRVVRADGATVDVALVHRRLAVIDPETGQQPMVSARGPGDPGQPRSGCVAVVFNGCIYNHRDLRAELAAVGHRFRTDHSDTEVLIHGWREWGLDLPLHLDGMFAAAIWDGASGSLAAIRDRFGEKPFYDRTVEGESLDVAFASSAAPLLALPWAMEYQDDAGLPARTIWSAWIGSGYAPQVPPVGGLGTLPAGSLQWVGPLDPATRRAVVRGREAEMQVARWWLPPPRAHRPPRDHLESLLRSSVHERLEADVPVGCFLSGGIDSGLVAAFAREKAPNLEAFTVRMPDPRFDETDAAAATARHLGLRHTALHCDARPAEDVVDLIQSVGLPYGDSSLLPTAWVSRAARNHVRVCLSGDGGDEMFCGYERYRAATLLGLMGPAAKLARLALPLVTPDGDPTSRRTRRSRFLHAAAHGGAHELADIFPQRIMREMFPAPAPALGGRAFRVTLGVFHALYALTAPILELLWREGARQEVWYDAMFYLPCDLMAKVDTASMRVGLEVRSPMLAVGLSSAALSATIPHLMPRGRRKALLRGIARRYLPRETVDRPKMGFAIPVGEWFRSDFGGMRQLLLDHLHSTEPFGPPSLGLDLDMSVVRRLLDEHMSARRDHSQRLYMLLVLSIWSRWLGQVLRRG